MRKIASLAHCFIALLLFAFSFSSLAFAQYRCPPYGAECPSASRIVLEKLIRDPSKKGEVFVDNLTLADYHFSPGEEVVFKIRVKNAGNSTFSKVEVIDFLPSLTDYVLESGGVRENIRQISRTFENFKPQETEEFLLRVKVKPADKVSAGVSCGERGGALNRVVARAGGQPDEEDTSSFCVERKVLGALEQPAAGVNLWPWALGFLAISGLGFLGIGRGSASKAEEE